MNKRILLSALVLMLAALVYNGVMSARAGQAPANRAAIEKQLVTNERAIMDAFAKNDPKGFHAQVAPDAMSIDGGGIMKVDAGFDKILAQVKMQSWNIEMPQFYWINDNTVILAYKWTGKGTFQGQPVPSPTWASTVWTNKGGKWTAVFHQESLAMPAPAPAPAGTKK
jgi:hypothetical protein